MFKKKPEKPEPIIKDPKQAAKALEVLFATEHIDRKKLLLESFYRGIALGAGGVIGATVLIGAIIWILSLFDTAPLIGPFIDDTKQTIQEEKNK